jgi:hypothetical protein
MNWMSLDYVPHGNLLESRTLGRANQAQSSSASTADSGYSGRAIWNVHIAVSIGLTGMAETHHPGSHKW